MAWKERFAGLVALTIAAAVLSACAGSPPAPAGSAKAATLRVPGVKALPGLSPEDIVALLGQPDLQRSEEPAELWQYRAADCTLSLFFYREQDGYRLVRAETWPRNLANGVIPARCNDETAPARAHLVALRTTS